MRSATSPLCGEYTFFQLTNFPADLLEVVACKKRSDSTAEMLNLIINLKINLPCGL